MSSTAKQMLVTHAEQIQSIDESLMEVQQSINQAENMLNSLEVAGQADSPTAEKIRGLLTSMREQRKKLMDSLSQNKTSLTFMQELAAKRQLTEETEISHPKQQLTPKPFNPPQPPTAEESETNEEIKSNHQGGQGDGGENIFGLMDSILGKTAVSDDPKWKLQQLEKLEGQIGTLKESITKAKAKAEQEVQDESQASHLKLENNYAFRELRSEFSNIQVLQETQRDRMKDVVSILNNHADRLMNMEDSINEMKNEMKRTTLNSMSERLLERLLEVHASRPHFILELFEHATTLDTDAKRQATLSAMKNVCSKPIPPPKVTPNGSIKSSSPRETSPSPSQQEIGQSEQSTQQAVPPPPPPQIPSSPRPTSDSDVAPSSGNEEKVLKNEERANNDVVSKMLNAASQGVNVNQVNEDVQTWVKELLPILALNYKDKILDNEVIAEAQETIGSHILERAKTSDENLFSDQQAKTYLLRSLDECLLKYKGKSVSTEAVNILSDIGTTIYKSILHAKLMPQ